MVWVLDFQENRADKFVRGHADMRDSFKAVSTPNERLGSLGKTLLFTTLVHALRAISLSEDAPILRWTMGSFASGSEFQMRQWMRLGTSTGGSGGCNQENSDKIKESSGRTKKITICRWASRRRRREG